MNDSPIIFLALALVAAFVLFAVISSGNQRGRRGRGGNNRQGGHNAAPLQRLDRSELATRWATIQAMAGPAGGGNGLRSAVSEADKLLDHVLRQSGAHGDSMADRLRSSQSRLSDRNAVWRAHKLRNALAHEVGFDLVPSQAREALRDFERALKDLGAL